MKGKAFVHRSKNVLGTSGLWRRGTNSIEKTPEEYVEKLVSVFREVRRVLRNDGTLWLNLGDTYASAAADRTKEQIIGKSCKITGHGSLLAGGKHQNKIVSGLKPKDLVGIPWMVAFALRADGWYLRQDIIWHKPNPMPESVKDRCTKSHEYIFLLSKSQKYYYDYEAIKEPGTNWGKRNRHNSSYVNGSVHLGTPQTICTGEYNCNYEKFGRNKRSVWTVPTRPFSGSHFATFPPELIEPCIKAGCPIGGIVLDLFFGSGTTGLVAYGLSRKYIGIELNPKYAEMAENRIKYGIVDEEALKIEKQQGRLL